MEIVVNKKVVKKSTVFLLNNGTQLHPGYMFGVYMSEDFPGIYCEHSVNRAVMVIM